MTPRHRDSAPAAPLTLRARSRILFPYWSRRMRAQWVIARRKVDQVGTWRFPVGEKHIPTAEVAEFLRTLPPGPALEIVPSAYEKRRQVQRFAAILVKGRRA